MAKIKYDLSNVEDIPDLEPAPVGTYRAKLISVEPKESSKGNAMLEVRFHLTHSADGKKLKTEYADIWEYPILDHDHPFVQNKLKEFLNALGMKVKGTLDTDKMVNETVQVKLKSDTDQDGEYKPRIGKYLVVTAPEPEDEDEDEAEDEDGDDDAIDLDDLDRAALKKLIKDEELEITVKKAMTDDQLREAIAEAMSDEDEDEDEDEAEDEDGDEEEDDDDAVDLDALDRNELKALIKAEGLDVKVLKKDDDDALRAKITEAMGGDEEEAEDDEEESDAKEDYTGSEWGVPQLKAELKERELSTSGAKAVLIKRLMKDDGDTPF